MMSFLFIIRCLFSKSIAIRESTFKHILFFVLSSCKCCSEVNSFICVTKEVNKHYYDLNRRKYKGYSSYIKTGKRLKYIQLLEKEKDIKEQMFKITAENGKTVWTSEEDAAHRQKSIFDPYDYED